MKALQAAQLALLDKLRDPVQQLIDHSEQAAGAYQLNLQYDQATQTLEDAATTAEAEYQKHPDDKGFHALWLQALRPRPCARRQEGEVSPASQSLPLLAQSASDLQRSARENIALGDRRASGGAKWRRERAEGKEREPRR